MVTGDVTLPRLLARNAVEFGALPALSLGDRTLTWAQLRAEAIGFAAGLRALGLSRGERMMIMMSTRPEHWIADFAAAHLAAIPCTAYQTLSSEQVGYVAAHSAATVVVLEGRDEVGRWLPVLDGLPALKRIVVLDAAAIPADDTRFVSWDEVRAEASRAQDEELDAIWQSVQPADPIAMMYTSGTTGDPKGVVLSHRNAFWQAAAVDSGVPSPMHSTSIAYLPLAHIAERELGFYYAAYKALHVVCCPDPAQVVAALAQARPAGFFGVPRVWEKLAAGLSGMIARLPDAQQQAIMQAHGQAVDAYRLDGRGEPVPAELARRVAAADDLVLKPIRARLGVDTLDWASSGAAPIPVDVLEYLGGFGIRIYEVWGLSETTGSVTMSTADAFRPGKVGRPISGEELRIAGDGEIFVRGPNVFLGYLQADGTIASALDEDGWFATGDVGAIDSEGFLTITDRKKELLITSSGKNVAPTKVEGLLRPHPLVGQAIAIGDGRPYLTALITLDEESAPQWAAARGIATTALADLAADERVRAELDALVASANERLARPEQIKSYLILGDAWSPESGELTPTLKLRRRVVLDRYGERIDGLYSAPS